MKSKILKVHPDDNIIVALQNLEAGEHVVCAGCEIVIVKYIPVKHKFASIDIKKGEHIIMYGVIVGKATEDITSGALISTKNTAHDTSDYQVAVVKNEWMKPDISRFEKWSFYGYHRGDGKVGTRNYWLVIPLVFCENRNVKVIEESMLEQLGYAGKPKSRVDIQKLISQYENGYTAQTILETKLEKTNNNQLQNRVFKNLDGIKFLRHDGGCGGIRQDSETLCRLIAGYIANPNVAGATILSLGCQNAQIQMMKDALAPLNVEAAKPVYYLEQQESKSESEFIADAVKQTFVGCMYANDFNRKPAPLSQLTLGLECGGSDGFSGISANPALGHVSDLLIALGGRAILAEFPELNGVEQELIHRCTTQEKAEKFAALMRKYAERAEKDGSGFEMNPSPGNIRDGLVTDAMKSAGAAKKGGTSPIVDVLDYTEQVTLEGLSLLCTPGNDVESTTGLAGSGANLIVFTTGLGTPTGNPIAPTVKVSSNSGLAMSMSDLIDIDAGKIVSGDQTIEQLGEKMLKKLVAFASGEITTKAEQLGQDDFIPWKRGISL